MKDLKAIRGAFYIRRLIEQGEHENQDFKFAISDARKIARSISAFANNSGRMDEAKLVALLAEIAKAAQKIEL